jgi:SAM-dependent methyltransferase
MHRACTSSRPWPATWPHASFDLVVTGDVLHHVPDPLLPEVWQALAALPRPGGWLVVKEWVVRRSPIYHLGWFSDRVITGDRIHYRSRDGWLAEMALHLLPQGYRVVDEWVLRPWATNHAFVLQRSPPPAGD